MAPPKKSLRNYLQISQKQRINPFSKTQGRSLLGGLQHEEMNQGMKRAHRGKEAIAGKKNYLFTTLLNMDKFREISELNVFFLLQTH